MPQYLRSILPPQAPGGVDDTIPRLVGGDTAMMPIKGLSGISISSENSATRRSRSMRINFAARLFQELRQHAFARTGIVDAVRHAKLDIVHTHFQRVARLGAFDVNRPGENMHARPFGPLHFGINRFSVGQNFVAGNAVGAEKLLRDLCWSSSPGVTALRSRRFDPGGSSEPAPDSRRCNPTKSFPASRRAGHRTMDGSVAHSRIRLQGRYSPFAHERIDQSKTVNKRFSSS